MYFQLSYEDTQGSPTIDKKAWDFFWQNKQKYSEKSSTGNLLFRNIQGQQSRVN